jgi:PEP-CTERM motif
MKHRPQLLLVLLGSLLSQAEARVQATVENAVGGLQNVIGTQDQDFVSAALPANPSGAAGPVSASANSTTGKLRTSGSSPAETGDTVNASARLSDILVVSVAGTLPSSIMFNGFLEGSVGIFGDPAIALASGSLNLRAEVDTGTVESAGRLLSVTANPNNCNSPPMAGSFCEFGTSIFRLVSLTVELPPGESRFNFSAVLGNIATRGASFDFSNTASVWYVAPSNVTVTPSTLGFLSAAAPVPEPSTVTLFAFGAVGILLSFRRRRMQGHN